MNSHLASHKTDSVNCRAVWCSSTPILSRRHTLIFTQAWHKYKTAFEICTQPLCWIIDKRGGSYKHRFTPHCGTFLECQKRGWIYLPAVVLGGIFYFFPIFSCCSAVVFCANSWDETAGCLIIYKFTIASMINCICSESYLKDKCFRAETETFPLLFSNESLTLSH